MKMKTQKKKVHIDLSLLLVSSELHQNKDEWNGNVGCHGSRKKKTKKKKQHKKTRIRRQTNTFYSINFAPLTMT